jgi:palmitoyltransferase
VRNLHIFIIYKIKVTLFEAAQRGSFHDIRFILENNQATVTDVDSQGATALHYASISNNDLCIRYLLDRGAPIDVPGGELKATPLHWASR